MSPNPLVPCKHAVGPTREFCDHPECAEAFEVQRVREREETLASLAAIANSAPKKRPLPTYGNLPTRMRALAKDVRRVAEDDRETSWCFDYAARLEAMAKEAEILASTANRALRDPNRRRYLIENARSSPSDHNVPWRSPYRMPEEPKPSFLARLGRRLRK